MGTRPISARQGFAPTAAANHLQSVKVCNNLDACLIRPPCDAPFLPHDAHSTDYISVVPLESTLVSRNMSDFGHYGGSDEDYAAVRKHNAEVVSISARSGSESLC